MNMEETIAIKDNPIKYQMVDSYMQLVDVSSNLRNVLLSKAPGNANGMFNEFRRLMFKLFDISHRYLKPGNSVVAKVHKWQGIKTKYTPKYMLMSIDLYNEYIGELVKNNVIEMKGI